MQASICRYDHFLSPWYERWTAKMGLSAAVSPEHNAPYRKIWEWCAILETLHSRGLLQPGRKGLGFAVGREPLPAVMASLGVRVVASDLMRDQSNADWISSGQHASSLEDLYKSEIVDRAQFDDCVSFVPIDMNNLDSVGGGYDFLWSSCAFEHLGSLDHGMNFVCNAMRLLNRGGIAVHTTEYNVSSDEDTIETGDSVIYRKSDIERLDRRLRKNRCGLEPINWTIGSHVFDLDYDSEPYFEPGRVHIKLELHGYVSTSMLIIAVKA